MNCRSNRKQYSDWIIPEESAKKLALSRTGIDDLDKRAIRCPKCNKIQFYAMSDCRSGHADILCSRCKEEFTISFRLFHTRRSGHNRINEGYLTR